MKKQTQRTLLVEGFSLIDPEVRGFINSIFSKFPPGHWARSRNFDRLASLVGPWIEQRADTMSPMVSAITQKLGDYLEMTAGELSRKEGQSPNAAQPTPVGDTSKARDNDDDWVERFARNAEKRIHEAADPAAEVQKIKAEFQARIDLADFVTEKIRERNAERAKNGPSPTAATDDVRQNPSTSAP